MILFIKDWHQFRSIIGRYCINYLVIR